MYGCHIERLTRCGVHVHVAAGLRDFNSESVKLAYGEDSPVLANKQVAAVQSLSGTGSCRLFAEFQKRFLPNSSVYIPVVSRALGFGSWVIVFWSCLVMLEGNGSC